MKWGEYAIVVINAPLFGTPLIALFIVALECNVYCREYIAWKLTMSTDIRSREKDF